MNAKEYYLKVSGYEKDTSLGIQTFHDPNELFKKDIEKC